MVILWKWLIGRIWQSWRFVQLPQIKEDPLQSIYLWPQDSSVLVFKRIQKVKQIHRVSLREYLNSMHLNKPRKPNLRSFGVHSPPLKNFHAFNLTTLVLLRHGTAVFFFSFILYPGQIALYTGLWKNASLYPCNARQATLRASLLVCKAILYMIFFFLNHIRIFNCILYRCGM